MRRLVFPDRQSTLSVIYKNDKEDGVNWVEEVEIGSNYVSGLSGKERRFFMLSDLKSFSVLGHELEDKRTVE